MEGEFPVRNFKQCGYILQDCPIFCSIRRKKNFRKFKPALSVEWKVPEVYSNVQKFLTICDPVDPVSRIFWSNSKQSV